MIIIAIFNKMIYDPKKYYRLNVFLNQGLPGFFKEDADGYHSLVVLPPHQESSLALQLESYL